MAEKIHLNLKNDQSRVKNITLDRPIGYDAFKELVMSLQDQLENGYPFLNQTKTRATFAANNRLNWFSVDDPSRKCVRCKKAFSLDTDGNIPDQKCVYREKSGLQKKAKWHVVNLMQEATLQQFIATPEPNGAGDYRSKKAYALDTEFVYTQNGLEVARVTLLDTKKQVVMDTFVRPKFEILDFNTKYSGIIEQNLKDAITLEQCHQELFQYVNSNTILIGHSLEADLKALRLCHFNVIDTAVMFAKTTDSSPSIIKIALRKLAKDQLGQTIQSGSKGHCPVEDATTCIDLILRHIHRTAPKPESIPSESTSLNTSGSSSCAPQPSAPPPHSLFTPVPLMTLQLRPMYYHHCDIPGPAPLWQYWNRCSNRTLMAPQVVY